MNILIIAEACKLWPTTTGNPKVKIKPICYSVSRVKLILGWGNRFFVCLKSACET